MPSISASVTLAPCAACSRSLPPERSQLDARLRRLAVPQARQVAQAAAEGSVVANFFLAAKSFVPRTQRYLGLAFWPSAALGYCEYAHAGDNAKILSSVPHRI